MSVRADLATALSMVVRNSDGNFREVRWILKLFTICCQVLQKRFEEGRKRRFSESELMKLVGPVIIWMEENMPPFATIIIDSKGATVLKLLLRL